MSSNRRRGAKRSKTTQEKENAENNQPLRTPEKPVVIDLTTPSPSPAPVQAPIPSPHPSLSSAPIISSSPLPQSSAAPASASEPQKEETQCGICWDGIKEQGVLNACAHTFCFDCIMHWSKTANTCPMCKVRFSTITPKELKPSEDKKKKKRRRKVYQIRDKEQRYEPTRAELLELARQYQDESDDEDWIEDDIEPGGPVDWFDDGLVDDAMHILLRAREEADMNSVSIIDWLMDDSEDDLDFAPPAEHLIDDDGFISDDTSSDDVIVMAPPPVPAPPARGNNRRGGGGGGRGGGGGGRRGIVPQNLLDAIRRPRRR